MAGSLAMVGDTTTRREFECGERAFTNSSAGQMPLSVGDKHLARGWQDAAGELQSPSICHSERSEESPLPPCKSQYANEILRYAQDDRFPLYAQDSRLCSSPAVRREVCCRQNKGDLGEQYGGNLWRM
jgi:hypothetical protein